MRCGVRITAKPAQIMKGECKRLALATQCIGGEQGVVKVIEMVGRKRTLIRPNATRMRSCA